MKKYIPKSFRRILAMLLCVAMLLPLVAVTGNAAASDDGTFTILAGSDFQVIGHASESDLNETAATNMGAILDKVLAAHSIDALLFGGDYSSITPSAGYGEPQYVLNGYNRLDKLLNAKGLGNVQKIFLQGNHDHVDYSGSTLKDKLPFLNMTGGYALGDAAMVYVMNFVDYNSGSQNPVTVRNTAANLKSWLDQQPVGEKPIFVFSHVPLHHSARAYKNGDAQYAEYIVDVLNAAGQRGLNIIFLYGHNHSDETNNHMGGSTCYVAKGESIWVPNTSGTQLTPKEKVLNFTYMNAGFVSWFGPWGANAQVTDELTMSVFQIRGDDVTITRYSKDGKFPLQEKAGTFYTEAESKYGYTVDSIVVPATTVTVYGSGSATEDVECVYQQVNTLEDGKNYVIMLSNKETAKATGLRVSSDGVTLKAFEPAIAQYNSAMPYLLISDPQDPSNAQNESWTFHDPDGDGYGTLVDENGKYLTYPKRLTGVESVGAVPLEVTSTYTGADVQLWTYVEGVNGGAGLISKATTKNGTHIQFIYNNRDGNWDAIGSNYDTGIFKIAYIYERTPLTYTLKISDKVGEVAVGGTETGSMIVKTWSTGKIEYIPVTVSMLSAGSSNAGTYSNLTVTYGGTKICSDYTLIVGGGNEIALDESEYGWYYRLADHFTEGKDFNDEKNYQYLILDRNDAGTGVMMEAQGYSDKNVVATNVAVTLDADGVPSVQSRYVTNTIHQEWWKHKHSDGVWYLWQPNWSGNGHNYLRIAAAAGAILVTGQNNDAYTLQGAQMRLSGSQTTVNGYMPKAGETMYIQYSSDTSFAGVRGNARLEGREVYIYEKVSYTTAAAAAADTNGQVQAGSKVSAKTGTVIRITYPDGQVKTVDVTVDMLYIRDNGQLKQLTASNIAAAKQLTGLTLQYRGVVLTDGYSLVVTRG